ncbi:MULTISPECIES: DUF1206 domain-containing protein [unclassified Bacillus (in: firmicutes)]|uniref:DUF1206 domain-containing protein n=1 Tax=unclassified Bacillus (in: firmicutes) TaxID=185979 RepID=UPI0008E2BE85|nr:MULTISPECIES: DUF1206 domain-containing protein [unclassified Bacillus (in: firmicutes)]SFA91174.1 protein of unknown function [Bacillus sp. UNCCL13]SFQ85529.1 protein of unknown function [Bacillus sp. cl95]
MKAKPVNIRDEVSNGEEPIKETANKIFEIFTKIGYISKGSIYIFAGFLSFLAALGSGDKPSGTEGVLTKVEKTPFGEVLLWLIAAGLTGYVCWRGYQIVFANQEDEGGVKVFLKRVGYFISAFIYGMLAYKAVKIALHIRGGDFSRKSVAGLVLQHSYGDWLVGLVGAIIIGVGFYELYCSIRGKFIRRLNTSQMGKDELKIGKKAGKYGLLARSIVLFVIGYFLIQTSITMNSNNAIGMDGALLKIAQQPYGKWLLGIVSGGLILYGLFEIIKGKNHILED